MNKLIEEYKLVTVWKKNSFGVSEKCFIGENEYVGEKTNQRYSFTDGYYHSPQYLATVKSVDDRNLTGMFHLCGEWSDDSEENAKSKKGGLVDSELIVEPAHWAGERRIYRSVYPVFEYWSDLEIEVTETEENRIR